MPIEIREVTIKIIVEDNNSLAQGKGGISPAGLNNTSQQQMLVNACVKKVLEIIKDRKYR